ncbi:MAG: Gx transporter family protein [Candidatus Syntrophosphaera sp.]
MRRSFEASPLLKLAFLAATACSIHIFETLIMRLLPLPFIRLGLSNIIVLYLILDKKPLQAVAVNVTKSIVGGVVTFTLLTPATLLSITGGLAAVLAMWVADGSSFGFSSYGVSIAGAEAHNLMQLLVVHWVVLPGTGVFVLTPILLLLGLFSGFIIAWILSLVQAKFRSNGLENNEEKT